MNRAHSLHARHGHPPVYLSFFLSFIYLACFTLITDSIGNRADNPASQCQTHAFSVTHNLTHTFAKKISCSDVTLGMLGEIM